MISIRIGYSCTNIKLNVEFVTIPNHIFSGGLNEPQDILIVAFSPSSNIASFLFGNYLAYCGPVHDIIEVASVWISA